jgi:hypothetical protein
MEKRRQSIQEEELTSTKTDFKVLEKELSKQFGNEGKKYIEKENEMQQKAAYFSKKQGEICLCLSVDGSESSDQAFDMFYNEYLSDQKSNFKILIMHVFNDALDEKYNYRNKKQTVISNYELRTQRMTSDRCLFYYENRTSKIHALEQICQKAYDYGADYIITGYYGIKGPRGSSQELSKGIDYLLLNARLPTIIIKELHMRDKSKGKGFKWLFVLDRNYINCLRIVREFFPLVDKQIDFVHALTLLPTMVKEDDVKKDFDAVMEKQGFSNFVYESMGYKQLPCDIVTNMINFGKVKFDFVVIFNGQEKYRIEKEENDSYKIIKNSLCNVCFYNGRS